MEIQNLPWQRLFEACSSSTTIETIVLGIAQTSKFATNCVLVGLWQTFLPLEEANRDLFAYGARPAVPSDYGLEIVASDKVERDASTRLYTLSRTYRVALKGDLADKSKQRFKERCSVLNYALSKIGYLHFKNPHRPCISFALGDEIKPIVRDNRRKDDWISEWFMPPDSQPKTFYEQCKSVQCHNFYM